MNTPIAHMPGVSFHHLGLLTDEPELAITALVFLGYTVAGPVYDPLQDVDLRMAQGPVESARIEVITPRAELSGLGKLLRRRGDYMYHSCFTVRDLDATLAGMRAVGLRIITVSESKPAVLFDGDRVSFHSVAGLGLIEFIEHAD